MKDIESTFDYTRDLVQRYNIVLRELATMAVSYTAQPRTGGATPPGLTITATSCDVCQARVPDRHDAIGAWHASTCVLRQYEPDPPQEATPE